MPSEGSAGLLSRFDDEAIAEAAGDLRRWHLVRHEDESGVSGTGVVASGVEFHDGRVAYRWRRSPEGSASTFQIADRIEDVEKIHGHGGRTQVVWEDAP